MAGVDQPLDQGDDRLDAPGGERLGVGAPEAECVGVGDVMRRHLLGKLHAGHARGRRGGIDLVVDVGDVGDELHLIPLVAQKPRQLGEDDEVTSVSDMDPSVDRRAAGVDAHPSRPGGDERADLTRERVVQGDRAHPG